MGLEGVVSMQKEMCQCWLFWMVVGGEMVWTLGSWSVEGGSEGRTKEGSGRGVAVVGQSRERRKLVAV